MGVEVLASQERFQGGTVLVLFLVYVWGGTVLLGSPGWPQFLTLPLPEALQYQDYRYAPPCPDFFFFLFGFPLCCLIIKHLSLARKVTPPLTRSWQRLSVRNHTGDAANMLTLLLRLLSIKTNVKTSYLEKELLKAVDSSPEPKKRDAVLAVLG